MKILLDTCVFIWIVEGDTKLSDAASALFSDPGNEVYLSAVSVWEILVKTALNKLRFKRSAGKYVIDFRRQHHIQALPLHERACLHLAKLPDLHRDPFDRMLICQAIEKGMTILTPDRKISNYPVRTHW